MIKIKSLHLSNGWYYQSSFKMPNRANFFFNLCLVPLENNYFRLSLMLSMLGVPDLISVSILSLAIFYFSLVWVFETSLSVLRVSFDWVVMGRSDWLPKGWCELLREEFLLKVFLADDDYFWLSFIFCFLTWVRFWINFILALWPPLTLRDFFMINLVIFVYIYIL